MDMDYIATPPEKTFEKLWDDRSIPVDPDRGFEYHPMYMETPSKDTSYSRNILRGLQSPTQLGKLFFSDENLRKLDIRLRYTVYLLSGKQYNLGPQSSSELIIIMRSIYLNYAQHVRGLVKEEVRRLNNIIIAREAPKLLSNATQYLKYLEDINESHKIVIANPLNVNNKGMNVLYTGTALGFGY